MRRIFHYELARVSKTISFSGKPLNTTADKVLIITRLFQTYWNFLFSILRFLLSRDVFYSMRLDRVRHWSHFRTHGLRGIINNSIDLQFDGNPSNRNTLENEPKNATKLLHERLPGSGYPQSRLYSHRPRHGLDFFYTAIPARRSFIKITTLNTRLFRLYKIIGHGDIGRRHF